MTKAEATGQRYNLKNLADLDRRLRGRGHRGRGGQGTGVSSLRNEKGVVINPRSKTKGANVRGEGLQAHAEQ